MRKIRVFLAVVIAILSGALAAAVIGQKLFHKKSMEEKKPLKERPAANPPPKPVPHVKIPAGKRLVALTFEDEQIISELQKGDKVDIIGTCNVPGRNMVSISRVILRNIPVYDIEVNDRKKLSTKKRRTVYLIMRPEDALKLYSTMKTARISLILSKTSPEQEAKEAINNNSEVQPVLASIFTPLTGPEIMRAPSTVKKDLSQNIPPGMRAITIKVKQEDGMCGFLKPGDHVDVVITCPFSKFASSGGVTPGAKGVVTEYRISSRVLLQDVIVLAIDAPLIEQKFGRPKITRVTLLVPAEDVPVLSAAADGSKKALLRLVLRNPRDTEKVRTKRCYLSDLISEKKVYRQIRIIKGTNVYIQPIFK